MGWWSSVKSYVSSKFTRSTSSPTPSTTTASNTSTSAPTSSGSTGTTSSGGSSAAPQTIHVLQGGGIKYGNVTYSGNAVVPNTGGKTANQIRNETFTYARENLGVTKGGTYSATITVNQQNTLTATKPEGGSTNSGVLFLKKDSSLLSPSSKKAKREEQIYVAQERKQPVSYGVPLVKPSEDKYLKSIGSTLPYYTLQSTTTDEAIQEGRFTSQIPQYKVPIQTKGSYLSNVAIIKGAETYYSGVKAGADEETLDKSSQIGVTKAYESYNNLTKSSKLRLNAAGFGVGVAQLGVGFSEFQNSLLFNMGGGGGVIREGDEIGFFKSQKVYYGGNLGGIATTPSSPRTTGFIASPTTYFKETFTEPTRVAKIAGISTVLVAGGYSYAGNVKSMGWGAGTAETVAGISPIKIQSGIYSQTLDLKNMKLTSFKLGNYRVYGGTKGNIKVTGYENIKTGVGEMYTRTPALKIYGGGAYVDTGFRTTFNPYQLGTSQAASTAFYSMGNFKLAIPSEAGLQFGQTPKLQARGVVEYNFPNQNIYQFSSMAQFSRVGSITQTKGGVTKFDTGRAVSISDQKYYGEWSIRNPSGKYRLSSRGLIRGTEYNLDYLFNQGGVNFYSTGGSSGSTGGGSTGGGSTGGSRGALKFASQAPASQFASSTPSIGSVTIATPTPSLSSSTITAPLLSTSQKTLTAPKIDTIQTPKVSASLFLGTPQITLNAPKIGLGNRQSPVVTPTIIQTPKITVIQTPKISTPRINTPSLSELGSPPQTIPFIGIPPFLLGGIGGIGGVGRVRSKAKYGYTPSYTALAFGIKGKKALPKIGSRYTGLEFRPITKDWTKQFNFTTRRKRKSRKRIALFM